MAIEKKARQDLQKIELASIAFTFALKITLVSCGCLSLLWVALLCAKAYTWTFMINYMYIGSVLCKKMVQLTENQSHTYDESQYLIELSSS